MNDAIIQKALEQVLAGMKAAAMKGKAKMFMKAEPVAAVLDAPADDAMPDDGMPDDAGLPDDAKDPNEPDDDDLAALMAR